MIIEEEPILDLKSLVNTILKINRIFKGQVWWRGQGDYEWHLSASVDREIIRKKGGYEYEQNAIFRFMQRASSRYPNTPDESDNLAWLFLMQHHGLPTRLLDWTESPLFGCYFAIEGKETKEEDGALFALSPYKLNHQQIGESGVLSPYHEKSVLAARKAFERGGQDVKYVVGIMPSETHIRLMVQLSVFTLHGSGLIFDELPDTDAYLVKFRIPKDVKIKLKEEIKYMGVRESNLFPDLDHLANEIKTLRFEVPPDRENSKDAQHPLTSRAVDYGSST